LADFIIIVDSFNITYVKENKNNKCTGLVWLFV